MLHRFRFATIFALLALLAPLSLQAQSVRGDGLQVRSGIAEKPQVIQSIQCGQTINSNITSDDFQLDDGSYFDIFEFFGQAGQTVTITMNSSQVDSYLFLLDPDDEVVTEDDNGNGGLNARITFTLDQTSDRWAIAANAFDPGDTGSYQLTLQCSPTGGGGDGFFADPAYPDFRFRVRITAAGSTIAGVREPNCQPETVCVSGALAGRSEVFIRIIGPRPNGFLWPTLVRFTPSRVVVDIRQVSTGAVNTYILGAIPPGTDELPGLQDRTGFLP